MNVLAFDTCLGALSVAVRWRGSGGEWLMRWAFEAHQGGHAERLMPMIAELLCEAGLPFSAIARIAVTLGPGSFTGVRAGVAAARGLALASGRPVVGTSSLAVMAEEARRLLGGVEGMGGSTTGARKERGDALGMGEAAAPILAGTAGEAKGGATGGAERGPGMGTATAAATRKGRGLAVAVDARRGMVFFQLFAPTGQATPPLLVAPDRVPGLIGKEPVTLVGSGAVAVGAAVAAAGGEVETHLLQLQPHARALAALAETLPPLAAVRPLYLRPPDVKPQAGL
jgi:tRNA threonylcarbamoyladenosine biosynthesis protein TsaB